MKQKVIAITFALLAFTADIVAQGDNSNASHAVTINVPEVALIDIEGGTGSINLSIDAPTEAGSPVDLSNATNNDLWLNYSSIVSRRRRRSVTAKISSGNMPQGLLLKVSAGAYSGHHGDGRMGQPVGEITLSTAGQTIINSIGSCYTGNGSNNGHNLTYRLELDGSSGSYAQLEDASTNITIQYTITDD